MKNYLCVLGLALFSIAVAAQTKGHKLGITSGPCLQQYRGDLGNGFKQFNSTYGAEVLTLGYYLDRAWDITVLASLGDYGFCQSSSMANKEVSLKYRCPGCKGRKGLGNLNSRMASAGLAFKYKLANGVIFKENARVAPYIYLGLCINHLTDRMKMNCINAGDYYSINTGLGFKYNFSERFNIGYNLGLGYFQSDKLDYIEKCGKDRYMQNTLFLGVNLF